jgi:hypothetical protein
MGRDRRAVSSLVYHGYVVAPSEIHLYPCPKSRRHLSDWTPVASTRDPPSRIGAVREFAEFMTATQDIVLTTLVTFVRRHIPDRAAAVRPPLYQLVKRSTRAAPRRMLANGTDRRECVSRSGTEGRLSLGHGTDGGDMNRSLSDSAKAILRRAFATGERTGVS